MGWQNILTQSDITKLIANTDITLPLSTAGFRGATIQNITPYYWQVQDSNGTILFYLEPWQQTTYPIEPDTQDMNFVSMVNSRPQVQSNSAPSSTWAIDVQLTVVSLPFKQKSLSISSAANVGLGGSNSVSIVGTTDVNVKTGSLDTNISGSSVTIDTNTINDYLTINPVTQFPSTQLNLNVAANGTQNFYDIPLGPDIAMFDAILFVVQSVNSQLNNLQFALVNFSVGSFEMGTYVPNPESFSYNANGGNRAIVNPIYVTNAVGKSFSIQVTNTTANAITDTLTIYPIARYAGSVVTNESINPVNTQGIPGGNQSSGEMSLTADTNNVIAGTQNITVTRLYVSFYNGTGSALPSGTYCFLQINGGLALSLDLSGMGTGWTGQIFPFDFGEGIVPSSNGIGLNPGITGLSAACIVVQK